jgi:hypothetical protein
LAIKPVFQTIGNVRLLILCYNSTLYQPGKLKILTPTVAGVPTVAKIKKATGLRWLNYLKQQLLPV